MMTDPRTPRTKEAQLPDALDQQPDTAAPERGSDDAQLLAGADAPEGEVETQAVQAND